MQQLNPMEVEAARELIAKTFPTFAGELHLIGWEALQLAKMIRESEVVWHPRGTVVPPVPQPMTGDTSHSELVVGAIGATTGHPAIVYHEYTENGVRRRVLHVV